MLSFRIAVGAVYNTQHMALPLQRPTPEALVQGRERTYFDYFWNDLAADKTHSIPEADRKAYADGVRPAGRMHAGWPISFPSCEAAKDSLTLTNQAHHARLSIAATSHWEKRSATSQTVATDVTVVVLKDTGHWILEERPKETTRHCKSFSDSCDGRV